MLKIADKVDGKLSGEFFLQMYRTMQLKLLMALILSIYYLFEQPIIFFANSLLGLITTLILLAGELYLLKISIQLEKWYNTENCKYRLSEMNGDFKRWLFLKNDLKDTARGMGRHFGVFWLLKDMVTCVSIMYFLEAPAVQIIPPMIYNGVLVVFVVVYWPLKDGMANFCHFFAAFSELLILAVFLALMSFETSSEEFKYKVIGRSMLVLMGAIFVAYIAIFLISTGRKIFKMLNKKEATKKVNKVQNRAKGSIESVKISKTPKIQFLFIFQFFQNF